MTFFGVRRLGRRFSAAKPGFAENKAAAHAAALHGMRCMQYASRKIFYYGLMEKHIIPTRERLPYREYNHET